MTSDAHYDYGSLFSSSSGSNYSDVTKPQLGHQIRIILAIKGIP